MSAFAPAQSCLHTRFSVASRRPTEFLDVTDRVAALVAEAQLRYGFVNVQSLHTTAAIVVNEHEPLLLSDFATMLERVAPRGATYSHDDPARRTVNLSPEERPNGHSHCRALLLPSSACLNVADGILQLGRWQRLFLVELDGPRVRDISVSMLGEGRR
jgi:secondary thiamine-phosphate synthase enzyme